MSVLTQILIPYQNQWVAVTKDRKKVLTFAKDAKSLNNKLQKIKLKEVIMMYVLPMSKSYSP